MVKARITHNLLMHAQGIRNHNGWKQMEGFYDYNVGGINHSWDACKSYKNHVKSQIIQS